VAEPGAAPNPALRFPFDGSWRFPEFLLRPAFVVGPGRCADSFGGKGDMNRLVRAAKWTACVFGGACAASFLMCLIAILRFGLHDAMGASSFLNRWSVVAGICGGLIGAFIAFRSERIVTP
jgi:hypothetical protein